MALYQSALLDLVEELKTTDASELMRRMLATMLQELIDAEASALIGALPHERTDARTTRATAPERRSSPPAIGDLNVKIPKTRTGSFFPALLAPRRRIDVALHAVIMQAYIEGVSTRRVDDLVIAMGGTGISKSEVSRICAQLDAEVAAWRTRPLDDKPFPYVFLDATYCKARINGRVVSQAVVIATGVSADGHREVLGCQVGDSETEEFWTEFLRDLRGRGLAGVQLVISDAHGGLVDAIGAVLQGAAWQRAGSTSCATCSPRSPRPMPTWSRPGSARSSPWALPAPSVPSSTTSPAPCRPAIRGSPRCCATPRPT